MQNFLRKWQFLTVNFFLFWGGRGGGAGMMLNWPHLSKKCFFTQKLQSSTNVLGTLHKKAPSGKYFPFGNIMLNVSSPPLPQNNVGVLSHHCRNRTQHCIGGGEGKAREMLIFREYRGACQQNACPEGVRYNKS